jgi:flagellar hook protein FlgE
MGIYGALSTAVTGLRAQSFALENISGNIANSQTTGFKRIDTDFQDLIPDSPRKLQTAGSTLAVSRATNTSQGDVKSVSNTTYMAVNGAGFFVVEPAIGQSDGASIFAGANYYTRRGDFDVNKNGYLVNGSGYYLKGLPIDAGTGNISSSLPEVIRISNSFLPAQPTTRVNYQLNLPQLPKNAQWDASKTIGAEIFRPQDFMNIPNDVNATATGAAVSNGTNNANTIVADGESLTIQVGAETLTVNFTATGGTSGNTIDITDTSPATNTVADVLAYIQTQLRAVTGTEADNATVGLSGGRIVVDTGNTTSNLTVTTDSTLLGFTNGTTQPSVALATQLAARTTTIAADDEAAFLDQTISGGAITVYSSNGAPANVQIRWGKIASADVGGVDRWNMFYLANGSATGSTAMWRNVGTDYTFGADGALNPPILNTDLTNVTIDGVAVGDISLQFGAGGLTQFNDANGQAGVTTLSQNGYPAGQFVSVAIDDNGRVVVSYDNGQQVETAQVVTAEFNAANQLKRLDGGIFAATADSGEPILDTSGGIVGSSLESSNTDISEEFTKLIVTQQAYAAGTRIVSTADQMIQEALNMVR